MLPFASTRSRPVVLVTGGAGFLGSYACESLLADGAEVLCVDNFYTGNRANISPLMSDPQFEVIRHDVNFPLYVEVDAIFNLACPASPVHYQRDPVQTTKTTVQGAINLIDSAKRTGARTLQASTVKSMATRDPPAAGELYRQSHTRRPAGLLRLRKPLCREAVPRLSPPGRPREQDRKDLQYLRAAHAAARRTGGLQLHHAGAEKRTADAILRRPPDAGILVRGRQNRRPARTHGQPSADDGPNQPRQPGKTTDRRTGRDDRGDHRLAIYHRAAAGHGPRSDAALPGYRQGAGGAGLAPTTDLATGLERTIDYFERLIAEG